MFETPASRRDFLKKTAYVTPLILTMNVSLAEAQAGSGPPLDRLEDFSTRLDSPSGSYQGEGTRKHKEKDNNGNHYGWSNRRRHRDDDDD